MTKLQTDHIDFYLLHGLNKQHWPKLRDLQVGKWAENTIKDGRIGYLGFSFHDDLATFKQIIDEYDRWTFCQIQYNFMDIEYQAGTEGLKYAANKGLALVIMEPLRGGQLAKEPPESVKEIWKKSSVKQITGGLGPAVALESTGGFGGPQRHDHHAAGRRQYCQCGTIGHRVDG